jgi:hypothetical protein
VRKGAAAATFDPSAVTPALVGPAVGKKRRATSAQPSAQSKSASELELQSANVAKLEAELVESRQRQAALEARLSAAQGASAGAGAPAAKKKI